MKKILVSLMVAMFMVACNTGSGSYNPPPTSSGQSTNPPAPTPTPTPPVGDLVGTWSKPCANAGDQVGFTKQTITVDATTATMQSQLFQNSSNCSGTADLEARSSLSYTVPSYTAGQVNQINMVVNSIKARINSVAAVAAANATTLCGFNDWQIGQEREVSGRNCIQGLPGAGQPYYDIFKIQGNQLFIGQVDEAHSGKTQETRPTQLESTPYTR